VSRWRSRRICATGIPHRDEFIALKHDELDPRSIRNMTLPLASSPIIAFGERVVCHKYHNRRFILR
jgi:hypothetical protein